MRLRELIAWVARHQVPLDGAFAETSDRRVQAVAESAALTVVYSARMVGGGTPWASPCERAGRYSRSQ